MRLLAPAFLPEWTSLVYSKPSIPVHLCVSAEHLAEYNDYCLDLYGRPHAVARFKGVLVVGDTSLAPGEIYADWKV